MEAERSASFVFCGKATEERFLAPKTQLGMTAIGEPILVNVTLSDYGYLLITSSKILQVVGW
jgi:hypothetical protein